MKILGIILIVLGVGILVYGGVSWTDRDEVLDAGPLEVTVEDREHVAIPPIVGAFVIAAGAVLVFAGRRKP